MGTADLFSRLAWTSTSASQRPPLWCQSTRDDALVGTISRRKTHFAGTFRSKRRLIHRHHNLHKLTNLTSQQTAQPSTSKALLHLPPTTLPLARPHFSTSPHLVENSFFFPPTRHYIAAMSTSPSLVALTALALLVDFACASPVPRPTATVPPNLLPRQIMGIPYFTFSSSSTDPTPTAATASSSSSPSSGSDNPWKSYSGMSDALPAVVGGIVAIILVAAIALR